MGKRIGEFLVEKGVLKESQVLEILNFGRTNHLRFGEAALEMGILTRETLMSVFGPHFGVDFFHLDAGYFPEVTKDLFPIEVIIEKGVLPLGIKMDYQFFRKKQRLNLGALNPKKVESESLLVSIAKARLKDEHLGIKIYLILADQFLDVLQKIYHTDEVKLSLLPVEKVDETLRLFAAP